MTSVRICGEQESDVHVYDSSALPTEMSVLGRVMGWPVLICSLFLSTSLTGTRPLRASGTGLMSERPDFSIELLISSPYVWKGAVEITPMIFSASLDVAFLRMATFCLPSDLISPVS